MQFTEEQNNILKQVSGSFRVLAAAGSGKTSTMSYLVKDEIVSQRTAETQICFITFTRFAADQIKTKMHTIMQRWTQVLYGTFNATMWKLLIQAKIELPEPTGLYDCRMEQGTLFFLNLMLKRDTRLINVLAKFKILIVDEFQDLDEHQFIFVKQFKEIQPNLRIIAIGDLAQNIYRFRGTSNEFLRTRLLNLVPDLKSFELTTNFRSTKQILSFVNILFKDEIKEGHILPMRAPKDAQEGYKPKYYEYAKNPGKGYGEYEELVALTLLPILKDAKTKSKSIVLIFPIIKCPSFQIITALLRGYSKREGYSFDIHQISKEDETCLTITFDYDPKDPNSPVQCSSFHSSKGLEWDIVIIINMSDSFFELRTTDEDSEAFYAEKINLAYVGVTRAAEELYIFANANTGGRCRLFAQLGADIDTLMSTTYWGVDKSDYDIGRLKPIGITDLIRKLPQNPDLYKRAINCSESIKILSRNKGLPVPMEDVYNEMKKRNRELAFGTFIDWKLKQMICTGKSKTLQDIIVELFNLTGLYLSRNTAYENIEERLMKLDIYFLNSNKEPNEDLIRYITASRYIALFSSRMRSMVPGVKDMWKTIGDLIIEVSLKESRNIKEEYILSQANNYYLKNIITEIQAVSAPSHLKQGLPEGFEQFVDGILEPGCLLIKACAKSVGIDMSIPIYGDVSLESKSLIIGEADMIIGDMLIEMKCGTHINPIELREAGSCKNLLQVLSYVCLGKYGTLPQECTKAAIINPMTGAWEVYDIGSWSDKDSFEFMSILEELRLRV